MTVGTADHRDVSLRFRLRSATADLHHQTEQLFALNERMETRESYRDLLARLYGFHVPMERLLSRIGWDESWDIDRRLGKSRWIAEDLAALGMAPAAIAMLPACRDLPRMDSISRGLGALYVVEGATLGGQVISRALHDRLDVTPQAGGRFFSSYGSRIGSMWREFVAVIDAGCAAVDEVECAAAETFRAFGAWIAPTNRVANG